MEADIIETGIIIRVSFRNNTACLICYSFMQQVLAFY